MSEKNQIVPVPVPIRVPVRKSESKKSVERGRKTKYTFIM